MQDIPGAKYYPRAEERVNIVSHAIGLALSIVAFILLVLHATRNGNVWHVISFAVFGASLITLYAASTRYHSSTAPERRTRLRVVDHASIYILIAGTYTPFALVVLKGAVGWTMFAAIWTMAIIGIVLKLFFTGRYKLLSTLMYVFMGWLMLVAIKPLMQNFSSEGLKWLAAGGISYTVGAILYSIPKLPFHHAIFHIFVLAGSITHFIAVYFFILPT